VTLRGVVLQVRIDIYEGEARKATENKLLDTFTLSDIPALPAGEARIMVTFRVDFDGTLSASAEDRTPGPPPHPPPSLPPPHLVEVHNEGLRWYF